MITRDGFFIERRRLFIFKEFVSFLECVENIRQIFRLYRGCHNTTGAVLPVVILAAFGSHIKAAVIQRLISKISVLVEPPFGKLNRVQYPSVIKLSAYAAADIDASIQKGFGCFQMIEYKN
ncbi:hypothetical protein SDC9_200634 [bioreactor metagenome]|uniref:Uncharacterized protein n=1 Tax=bioreactor metagenome TaxID=1076179 RepID=A0A645INS1_9ZZZZ